MIKLKNILTAKKKFDKNIVKHTPLEKNFSLSKKYWANIFLKREDLQIVRSYKLRWAFNAINSLSEEEKSKWVVCASAWNHAQWVAIVSKWVWIKAYIFMPKTTPSQQVRKTKKFWWENVEVILFWDSFDEAFQESQKFCEEKWATFVHPFDDLKVIEWQWTIWLEILEEDFWNEKIDYVFLPIWWWWLASWVSSVFKELSPETKIIWVESENSASMKKSIKEWKVSTLEKIDTFCDWVAVKTPWKNTFKICQKNLDEFMEVEDWKVAWTLLWLLDDQWIITEPSWSMSITALDYKKDEIKWKNVVCVISWWNFDFARLEKVEDKSQKFLGLKKYFLVNFPQRPWALKDFLNFLWEEDDIVFFEYIKKKNKEQWPAMIWIESLHKENFAKIEKNLRDAKFSFDDITNNEFYSDFLI